MSSKVEDLQDRFAAVLIEYGELLDEGEDVPPFTKDHQVPMTAAVRASSAILTAAEIELFELQMWRAMGR